MKQYKVSLHYNMKGHFGVWYRNRTFIWDREERPIYVNCLVRKKITGKLAEDFINLKAENNQSDTLEELMTTHLGRRWIKEIKESKVKEYETKP